MASQPEIPPPDVIEPQSPPETPSPDPLPEQPYREPPEIVPDTPDIDEPGQGPDEVPEMPDTYS